MRYFPDPISSWCFLAALLGVLAIASYNDERFMKVPKWLTIPALAIGVLLSLLRGAYMASHGLPVWILGERGVLIGMVDGFLFALAGFLAGFGLFFCLWVLGVCGGGDVKLFAALGTWIGPYLLLLVLLLSLILLSLCLVVVVAYRLVRGKRLMPATRPASAPAGLGGGNKNSIIVRFSLVAALATILVVLWAFRMDLGLMQRQNNAYSAEATKHAR